MNERQTFILQYIIIPQVTVVQATLICILFSLHQLHVKLFTYLTSICSLQIRATTDSTETLVEHVHRFFTKINIPTLS